MEDKTKELIEDLYKLINSQRKLIDSYDKENKELRLKKNKTQIVVSDNSVPNIKYEALKKEFLKLEKHNKKLEKKISDLILEKHKDIDFDNEKYFIVDIIA